MTQTTQPTALTADCNFVRRDNYIVATVETADFARQIVRAVNNHAQLLAACEAVAAAAESTITEGMPVDEIARKITAQIKAEEMARAAIAAAKGP